MRGELHDAGSVLVQTVHTPIPDHHASKHASHPHCAANPTLHAPTCAHVIYFIINTTPLKLCPSPPTNEQHSCRRWATVWGYNGALEAVPFVGVALCAMAWHTVVLLGY